MKWSEGAKTDFWIMLMVVILVGGFVLARLLT